ncbi:hypothetical protein M2302_002542 [Micromonospora sp. A200]|uniref:hypothetical protein n=1 Tax=Micromonospora sp. A200 TaxID=2940568 RepID=UPI002476EC0C|nr:hypothetical protein [Micromonospora sp. A200]MDH6462364.1 hypothetical protein [Micromonospora sp. A200]
MPAKRSPKKSRPSAPAKVAVSPPDLDALTVAPAAPVTLPEETGSAPAARPAPATPPWTGPPVRGGSTAARGQTRRYAFRRS